MAKEMPELAKEQLVLSAVDKDPTHRQGPASIQQRIAYNEGVHLPRNYVTEVMKTHVPDGFSERGPTAKKILRVVKAPIGINERWAGDGHDKLYSIGFPVWAVVDDATSKWLGAWVVPSNRLGTVIVYLGLCLIEKMGGNRYLSKTHTTRSSPHLNRAPSAILHRLWFRNYKAIWSLKCPTVSRALVGSSGPSPAWELKLNAFSERNFFLSTMLMNCPPTSTCEAFTILELSGPGFDSDWIGA